MKKNWLRKSGVVFATVLCLMSVAGCGKKEGNTEEPKAEGSKTEGSVVSGIENLDKYVTLGEYKGLTYTEANLEVTAEELQTAIDSELAGYAEKVEVMDREVKQGDTANIDFVGYRDGVAFEGGTGAGYDLVIGSGSMIPGFEEGIVGMMPGETKSVDVTFPEAYRPEGTAGSELNGQPAVFDITVNHIVEVKKPDYTEEFVKEKTEYESMEAFEQSLKDELAETKKTDAENAVLDELFNKLIENATIHELPESELTKYHDNLINSYQAMADSLGMELSSFLLQYYYATEDDLEAYANQYAELMAKQAVVFQAIAQVEGISVSEEEYQEGLNQYYENYGDRYDSLDAFAEEMGDLLKEELLYKKVEQFVVDHAVAVSKDSAE